nr:hypothetical protein Iba_chr06bCG4000 [Ipomoea batatas]
MRPDRVTLTLDKIDLFRLVDSPELHGCAMCASVGGGSDGRHRHVSNMSCDRLREYHFQLLFGVQNLVLTHHWAVGPAVFVWPRCAVVVF